MNCKKNRKEHLFRNAIHGIIESVDKVKDQKRTVFMEKIDHNAHSVYLMYYHLIMVVKYRRKVINDPISERAKEIWEYIAPRYGIVLEEWNHDIDHVHVMFRAQPKTELSKFINAYKSAVLCSLVMEQSDSGKYHRHVILITAFDDRIIPDGAAGLCNVFYAALMCAFNVIGKREECVRAKGYIGQLV